MRKVCYSFHRCQGTANAKACCHISGQRKKLCQFYTSMFVCVSGFSLAFSSFPILCSGQKEMLHFRYGPVSMDAMRVPVYF